jgi:hypothetical protein
MVVAKLYSPAEMCTVPPAAGIAAMAAFAFAPISVPGKLRGFTGALRSTGVDTAWPSAAVTSKLARRGEVQPRRVVISHP